MNCKLKPDDIFVTSGGASCHESEHTIIGKVVNIYGRVVLFDILWISYKPQIKIMISNLLNNKNDFDAYSGYDKPINFADHFAFQINSWYYDHVKIANKNTTLKELIIMETL